MPKDLKEEMEELALEGFKRLKEAGVEWGEWCDAGDDEVCDHCRAESGKLVRIETITKPWHEGCSCEYCRCVLIAGIGPDEDDDA